MITHTIWTTQEDTVFISDRDRNGGQCSMVRSDVLRDSLNVSESQKDHSFFLAFTDDEGVPRNVWSHHWTLTTVPVLSLIKTVSSCVVQIVCVITNQGSSNPNCLKSVFARPCKCSLRTSNSSLVRRDLHAVCATRSKTLPMFPNSTQWRIFFFFDS